MKKKVNLVPLHKESNSKKGKKRRKYWAVRSDKGKAKLFNQKRNSILSHFVEKPTQKRGKEENFVSLVLINGKQIPNFDKKKVNLAQLHEKPNFKRGKKKKISSVLSGLTGKKIEISMKLKIKLAPLHGKAN